MNRNPRASEIAGSEMNFAEYIETCQSRSDVHGACSMVGERHGFPYFSILRLPEKGESRLSEVTLLTNWPASLIRRCDENLLLERNPIFAALRMSTAPVHWDMGATRHVRADGKNRGVAGLFRDHDMSNGICLNVHSARGQRGTVSFSGDRKAPSEPEAMQLCYHSLLIFDRTCALAEIEKRSRPSLSKRELECIVWTSQGKTSHDIGRILGLSDHTVNNYLANVCRKLGAVNRAHLVGMALRMKLLD